MGRGSEDQEVGGLRVPAVRLPRCRVLVFGQQVVCLRSAEVEFCAGGRVMPRALAPVYRVMGMKRVMAAAVGPDSSAARGVLARGGPGRIRHSQTRWPWSQEKVE